MDTINLCSQIIIIISCVEKFRHRAADNAATMFFKEFCQKYTEQILPPLPPIFKCSTIGNIDLNEESWNCYLKTV